MTKILEKKLKKEFQDFFIQKMNEERFLYFFYNVFTLGTAYVVGGFFRDFINNKPSRDIDIIVDLKNVGFHLFHKYGIGYLNLTYF